MTVAETILNSQGRNWNYEEEWNETYTNGAARLTDSICNHSLVNPRLTFDTWPDSNPLILFFSSKKKKSDSFADHHDKYR